MFARRTIQPKTKRRQSEAVAKVDEAVASDGESDAEQEATTIVTTKQLKSGANKFRKPIIESNQTRSSTKKIAVGSNDQYESERQLRLHDDQKATAATEWDTPKDRDHRAVLERNEEIGKKILIGDLERGVYRGKDAYAPVLNRREGAVAASKHTGIYGPVRGTSEVRMTMRIDYNPEICKDYKETGYCGFGDTCKFLHDRSDYKSGWQLEKEYEEKVKKKQKRLQRRAHKDLKTADTKTDQVSNQSDDGEPSSSGSGSDDESKLPFACVKCKTKWGDGSSRPVVTKCGHYFCEKCAMSQYLISSKCAMCGEPTDGIFNSAEDILSKIGA